MFHSHGRDWRNYRALARQRLCWRGELGELLENVLAMETSVGDSVSFDAIERKSVAPDSAPWRAGLVLGCLGLLAFSGTLPATRLAVPVFGPTILTCSRIEISAVLGIIALCLLRGRRWPRRGELPGILWTGPDDLRVRESGG